MSKPASWTITYMNVMNKSIIMMISGVFIYNYSDSYSSFGMMLIFISIAKTLVMMLLLFLVVGIFNLHNKKNIITIYDSVVMIFSGLLFMYEKPYIGNNFGLFVIFIIIGSLQLLTLFMLYLWSNLIDLTNNKHLVILLEPIVLMLCRTFIDDFLVLTLLLRIIGGAQLIAIIINSFYLYK